MNHEYLISRNQSELAQVISVFHELNETYRNQFAIYLDSQGWELLDMRTGMSVIKLPFNQFRKLIESMRILNHDIIAVGCAVFKPRLSSSDVWSIKRLYKTYGHDDYFFSDSRIKNYIL